LIVFDVLGEIANIKFFDSNELSVAISGSSQQGSVINLDAEIISTLKIMK
jgi:hypothetical protein